jgi:DNA-binding transcriptional LysR family regulator
LGSAAGPGSLTDAAPGGRRPHGITLQQLRIFVSVAASETLTQAAKELGLAQPSLSQQIARLEETVGTRLFDRRSTRLELTEAGSFLFREAEPLLVRVAELEEGLAAFSTGRRGVIRIAGVSSVLRLVLPRALAGFRGSFPDIGVDVLEHGPAEVLDMLRDRRINLGLVPADSVQPKPAGFLQVTILEDPFVLAVPAALDLAGVRDPSADLGEQERRLLHSAIHFVFGSQRSRHVEHWFHTHLPGHRVIAQCRTFEVAMGMVRAGLGVCMAPALSAQSGEAAAGAIRLYRLPGPPRRIVAVVPGQIARLDTYALLLEELARAGRDHSQPEVLPAPPFLAATLDRVKGQDI